MHNGNATRRREKGTEKALEATTENFPQIKVRHQTTHAGSSKDD